MSGPQTANVHHLNPVCVHKTMANQD